jgi:FkbM family methyltransferase
VIRLVDAKRGRFLVFDNDMYVGRSLIELGEFSEEQAELFEKVLRPEAVVVEIGANIGALTVVLAKRVSKVHAFEPQRRVYNVLCANMALNECDNVDCYRMGAGDKRELMEIPMLDFSCESNNYGCFSIDSPLIEDGITDQVPMIPVNIPCDFLKIDVEGYEANVLRGSAEMIRECKPVLYVENDREKKSDELLTIVHEFGYKAYWHITRLFSAKNGKGVKVDPFNGASSYDLLCLPKDVPFTAMLEAKVGHLAPPVYYEDAA